MSTSAMQQANPLFICIWPGRSLAQGAPHRTAWIIWVVLLIHWVGGAWSQTSNSTIYLKAHALPTAPPIILVVDKKKLDKDFWSELNLIHLEKFDHLLTIFLPIRYSLVVSPFNLIFIKKKLVILIHPGYIAWNMSVAVAGYLYSYLYDCAIKPIH